MIEGLDRRLNNEIIVLFLPGCVSDRGYLVAPIDYPHVQDRPPDTKSEYKCRYYVDEVGKRSLGEKGKKVIEEVILKGPGLSGLLGQFPLKPYCV